MRKVSRKKVFFVTSLMGGLVSAFFILLGSALGQPSSSWMIPWGWGILFAGLLVLFSSSFWFLVKRQWMAAILRILLAAVLLVVGSAAFTILSFIGQFYHDMKPPGPGVLPVEEPRMAALVLEANHLGGELKKTPGGSSLFLSSLSMQADDSGFALELHYTSDEPGHPRLSVDFRQSSKDVWRLSGWNGSGKNWNEEALTALAAKPLHAPWPVKESSLSEFQVAGASLADFLERQRPLQGIGGKWRLAKISLIHNLRESGSDRIIFRIATRKDARDSSAWTSITWRFDGSRMHLFQVLGGFVHGDSGNSNMLHAAELRSLVEEWLEEQASPLF
jgi:hypothetical protein